MRGIRILKVAVYIIMVGVVIMAVPNAMFNMSKNQVYVKWLYIEIQVLATPIVLEAILYEFLGVIKTIEAKDTFNWNNVKRIRRINCYVSGIILLKLVINCVRSGVDNGIDLWYLLIIELFTQVVCGVFIEAYKLRNSEKVLKEEKELTI